jgi:hypothetical protein
MNHTKDSAAPDSPGDITEAIAAMDRARRRYFDDELPGLERLVTVLEAAHFEGMRLRVSDFGNERDDPWELELSRCISRV